MSHNSSINLFTLFLVFAFAHSTLAYRRRVKDELPGYELVLAQTVVLKIKN